MKCKLLLLYFLAAAFLIETNASPTNTKKNTQTLTHKTETAYEKLFKKGETKVEGLITLHRVNNQLYFEFPLQLLNKEMLLGSTVSEISDNGDAIVGQKPKDPLHIQFTKIDSTIQLRQIFNRSITRDKDVNIAQAIKQANIGAILDVYEIEAYNPDSTAIVFNVTRLFVGDNKALEPIDEYGANTYSGYYTRNSRFQSDKSFLGEIKAFKDNVIIKSHLSYECDIRGGQDYLEYKKPLTVLATRSLILLPEIPARPRIADPRIGIFPTLKVLYTNDDNRAKAVYYANRWRLEPSDETRFQQGEKVEPKQPIIFYIDSNFPEMWKKYIQMGVEDWNLAFEKIGFKNAIQTRPFPTDDPEFDPDNIKYSCIRYAPIWTANAMGPSWTDPRTGEIINASVYIYHNLVSLLYSWRFIHTAATDPDVRVKILPEEIMGDAIRYVTRHEVGHCFGFMHNMAASTAYPTEKLRDPMFTQKYGTTPSIMDYARFNYIAQPGDKEKGVKLTPPILGEYDYYLVKWNYSPILNAHTPEEEKATLNQWIAEKANNPIYRYGKQQIMTDYDPSSQTEDLGDDAMKSSEYGIKNLKYILANLNNWFDSSDKDYTHRFMLYNELVQQYVRYLNHVYANIGGIYLTERYVGDPRPSYESVTKEKQKRALHFLMKEIKDLEWIENKKLLKNFTLIGSPVFDLQNEIVNRIVASVERLPLCASKTDKDPYTPEECLDEIYNYIWATTLKNSKTNTTDRRLQNALVNALIKRSSGKSSNGLITLGITNETHKINVPDYIKDQSIQDFGMNTQSFLEKYANTPHNLSNEEISGFGYLQMVNYVSFPSLAHIYHGVLMRTKKLLERNLNHPSMETRNHYQLLLQRINKALN